MHSWFALLLYGTRPLARLVTEISVEKSFPIVTVCWGPTIGFRCEPAVIHNIEQTWGRRLQFHQICTLTNCLALEAPSHYSELIYIS